MKLKINFLIISFFYISSIFCQDSFFESNRNSEIRNEVVARVGDIKITAEEFIYSYEYGPAFPKRVQNSKQTYLNYMINEKLLALDGYEKGYMKKEEPAGMYSDIVSDLAAEEMFSKEIMPEIKINDAEIGKVIEKKQSEYEIRWLYAKELQQLESYLSDLKKGILFDSLYNKQFNGSVLPEDRQLTSSLYNIYVKNPQFGQIADTLDPGRISDPIHTDDGWYIIKIDNISKNLITGESEYEKLKSESVNAITKSKMEILSNQFIKDLFVKENPVIKRDVFNLLRSYLGKFILSENEYSGWKLDDKLETAMKNLGLTKGEKYPGLTLVKSENNEFTLDEFITWYRNRENYVKFKKDDLPQFSKSLEELVWLMVRDKLLSAKADNGGYFKSPWVKKQAAWWKDKISYSVNRNELAKSVTLNSEEIRAINEEHKSESEILTQDFTRKIFNKLVELRKKYKITVNDEILREINVSSENDKKAIEMYIVKRGNLIPRPAFPSIDNDWASWE